MQSSLNVILQGHEIDMVHSDQTIDTIIQVKSIE